MQSTTLTALLSILTLATPLAVTRIARDIAPESTTTLGSPLQFTRSHDSTTTLGLSLHFTSVPESTTTIGSPPQFTRSQRDVAPNSTTTLGSPLQFTRNPESTTTLGSPLQFTRTPESTTTLGSPLQFTRTPSSTTTSTTSPTATKLSVDTNFSFGAHYGWIGFTNSSSCEGDPIGDRPKIIDQACNPVNPSNETRHVMVFWGDLFLSFGKFDVFSDGSCAEGSKVRTVEKGEGTECFEMGEGEVWRGVQNKI